MIPSQASVSWKWYRLRPAWTSPRPRPTVCGLGLVQAGLRRYHFHETSACDGIISKNNLFGRKKFFGQTFGLGFSGAFENRLFQEKIFLGPPLLIRALAYSDNFDWTQHCHYIQHILHMLVSIYAYKNGYLSCNGVAVNPENPEWPGKLIFI